MLRVLGHPSAACDGLTRRDLLRAGSLAALVGGTAAVPTSASRGSNASPGKRAPAKAVILIDLYGGPSHIDTFDMKPSAPSEIRGEFRPIRTALPGVQVCEHLPLLAQRLNKLAVVRSVTHKYNSHNPYGVMTGFDGGQDQMDYFARPTNHPSVPSVCQYFGVGHSRDLPGYVMLPAFPGYSQGLRRAGPYGGYLGPKFDPVFSVADTFSGSDTTSNKDFYNPHVALTGEPRLPKISGELTLDALNGRRSLVQQLESKAARFEAQGHELRREAAFELLLSPKAKTAFDLSKEPEKLRDRYGRDVFSQSLLLARRLVEAGVTFVTVHTEAKPNGHWDTHNNNFNMLKHLLLPFLDRALSALIDDLTDRGLLESTLVVVTGDMGRTPKVNSAAGRDHWPQCGFCLFAGGGTKPGIVHGATDKIAAYPTDHPVSAGDLVSTIYHLVGVDPEGTVPDHTNRPIHISHGGKPIRGILA
ncbi:DUF1501 domain-containing protein [Gemmata sp. JC673]|uniref:DUF1501 domain-containing protein n=1 Tax=Gemmata algarum TaxID=2975278 RepID=A0ABU5F4V9_9BACT|nr:DUF1501 domain-containing protein [Gemmata algarum]MDY3561782.1 DUF1501 domain-containing protein [Gemmata algarum]